MRKRRIMMTRRIMRNPWRRYRALILDLERRGILIGQGQEPDYRVTISIDGTGEEQTTKKEKRNGNARNN